MIVTGPEVQVISAVVLSYHLINIILSYHCINIILSFVVSYHLGLSYPSSEQLLINLEVREAVKKIQEMNLLGNELRWFGHRHQHQHQHHLSHHHHHHHHHHHQSEVSVDRG